MNNYQKAQENRALALQFLAAHGYASTRQIAMSVWGECSASKKRMASTLLKRLAEARLIVTRRSGDSVAGELLAALTPAGAQAAADEGWPMPGGKTHARNYLRHAHGHRTACNSVSAALSSWPGLSPYSELEVQSGLAPGGRLSFVLDGADVTKIADLVVEKDGGGLIWCEVENSYRSEADLQKMVCALRMMFRNDSRRQRHGAYDEAWFIVTRPGAKNIGKRLRKALTHGPASGWPRQVRETDARILEQHLRVFTLDAETLELHPVSI